VDPTDTPGTLINRYLRTTQSPLDLQAALNEVIGLDGFYETCAVLEYYPCQDGSVIYLTDKGQVEIKQPHIPIAPGTTVQAATVPGQIIRCFCHATHGPDWYKFFDVPVNGIPASTLLPRALSTDRIPAGPILVEQDGDHARLYTGTSFGAQGTFDLMRSIADAQDSTSFSQYVLDNTEDGKFDFLNFLFEHVWLHTGLAVVYDSNRVTPVDIQRVQDFLHRNQPLNAVTFVIPE
jgi:hypothetical protein